MTAMEDPDAGAALAAAIIAAVAAIPAINGCGEGRPSVAATPYATLDIGPETDWGHKTGEGREVRFRLTVRDEGETPGRLRALLAQADGAIRDAAGGLPGWSVTTLVMLRNTIAGAGPRRWTGMRDYRARMLAR
jgi:hypothetical protein